MFIFHRKLRYFFSCMFLPGMRVSLYIKPVLLCASLSIAVNIQWQDLFHLILPAARMCTSVLSYTVCLQGASNNAVRLVSSKRNCNYIMLCYGVTETLSNSCQLKITTMAYCHPEGIFLQNHLESSMIICRIAQGFLFCLVGSKFRFSVYWKCVLVCYSIALEVYAACLGDQFKV